MNINTDNFRKQLNSCSRTQDKVAKDSINKGKSYLEILDVIWRLDCLIIKVGTIREMWHVKGKS